MKQEILNLLKAKYEGVSEAILSRIADKKAKTITTSEEAKKVVEDITFQQILESYGDSRATESQQTAVKNYEKQYGLKDGKKLEEPKPTPENEEPNHDEPTMPAWAKSILKSNETLTQELNALKSDKIKQGRKEQLDNVIKQLPENLRKPYSRMSLENFTDEDFTGLLEDVKAEVGGLVKEIEEKGLVFTPPISGKTIDGDELTEADLEKLKPQASKLKEGEQPF